MNAQEEMKHLVMRAIITLSFAVLLTHAGHAGEPGAMHPVRIEFNRVPLPAALTRLQDASGLRLVFAADVVKEAEPVTLSVKDEPVDSVLLRILRPRGLEFICTAETMAAIVPQASDAGMAKAAGRAIRTLARLAKKLEGAVQEGDEVRVPAWTEGDDRALAESIVGIVSAFSFAEEQQDYRQQGYPLLKMVGSYDRDVRLGCAVPAGVWPNRIEKPDDADRLAQMVRQMAADPDPELRGVGTFLRGQLRPEPNGNRSALAEAIRAAANDPAPEVRFAAALAAGWNTDLFAGTGVLESLRSDGNAAVRLAALGLEADRPIHPEPVPPGALAILKDRNPIARPLGIFFTRAMVSRDPQQITELVPPEDLEQDPWLKAVFDVCMPVFIAEARKRPTARMTVRDGSFSMRMVPAPAPVPGLPNPYDAMTRALASNKPSHQLLAAATFLAEAAGPNHEYRAKEPTPDFAAIAKLADSGCLWARIMGIVACAAVDTSEARSRVLAALKSDDEIDRLAALIGCARRPAGAGNVLAEIKAALLAAMQSPSFAQRSIAASAVANALPLDELVALFQDQARHDPAAARTALLLRMLTSRRELNVSYLHLPEGGDELLTQRQLLVLDAVLETGNAALQLEFSRRACRWLNDRNKPLLLTLIVELEPQAFLDVVNDSSIGLGWRGQGFAIDPTLDRLKLLYESGDAAVSLKAALAFTGYVCSGNLFQRSDEIRNRTLAFAEQILDDCLRATAPDGKVAAGLKLMTVLSGASGETSEFPESLRAGFVRNAIIAQEPAGIRRGLLAALKLAESERHAPAVARLVSVVYSSGILNRRQRTGLEGAADAISRAFVKEPQDPVTAAVDAARRTIMKKGKPNDQVQVLCGVAKGSSSALAETASAELEKRLLAGAIPAERHRWVLDSIDSGAGTRPPSAALARYLLQRLADRGEDYRLRYDSIRLLAKDPARMPAILDVLEPEAKGNPEFTFTAALSTAIGSAVARVRERNEPVPEWSARAAALGLAIAADPARPMHSRQQGIFLYANAAGAEAAQKLETFIQDDTLEPELRAAAAKMIPDANPETKVFAVMAAKYDALPRPLRRSLGLSAARAAKAGGAEAFFIRFLKDDDDEFNDRLVQQIDLPATPTLIAELKELENDPRIGSHVKNLLNRYEREKKR